MPLEYLLIMESQSLRCRGVPTSNNIFPSATDPSFRKAKCRSLRSFSDPNDLDIIEICHVMIKEGTTSNY